MSCHNCGRGYHQECVNRKGCNTCHPPEPELEFLKPDSAIRPQRKTEYKDAESTGRKRAAKLYPLNSNEDCDWRLRKNCGGGRRPIIGCADGKQQHRHHGPVKKTTYNHEGNVHRICSACHVHWHELNDLIYDEGDYNLLPHEPIEASLEEVTKNHLDWVSGEMGRRFDLKSAHNKDKKVLEATVD